MYRLIRKSSATKTERFNGHHRFEHWYVDNQVYFITARCREKYHAFASEPAKSVFWDRFDHYCNEYGYVPWVTSLLDNHYHTLEFLREGENLGPLMQRLHSSVAKLVNDLLPQRRKPFWRSAGNRDYFDGCIRDEKQCRRAYRYTLTRGVRHGLVSHWRDYTHTHVAIDLDRAVKRALGFDAFLQGVPYKRYERR